MIITIGGLAGSGTTTTTEVLSKKLDIPFISAGNIFRDMAKSKEMSLLEFSKFAENNAAIDIELDKRQAKIAKESENLIIEGRLSAHFVDADLRVWLLAPLNIRAERVRDREFKSMEIAIEEITIRENSESLRYLDIHNIDIHDFDIYDLVINTNRFNPDNIAEIILTTLKVI
ncbi:putative adenylate kinase [Candidatus Methanobinarius endosymbioticus]|uniref:Cytidylate kinase n=1 Tax=Candidatus Methanobinarius endosymbioticus TaxID=2006182 RepID=A0A366MAN2_9EURY|nr:putative adenylate kinase [Candidatus Methanobinarius endosymbioticus]